MIYTKFFLPNHTQIIHYLPNHTQIIYSETHILFFYLFILRKMTLKGPSYIIVTQASFQSLKESYKKINRAANQIISQPKRDNRF